MLKAMKRKRVLKAIDKRLEQLAIQMEVTVELWDERRQAGRMDSAKIYQQMYMREKKRRNRLSIYRQAYRAGKERHAL